MLNAGSLRSILKPLSLGVLYSFYPQTAVRF